MNTYNKERILGYWTRYFPESSREELDAIFQRVESSDDCSLGEEYERYEEYESNQIDDLVDFEYCALIAENEQWFGDQQLFTAYTLPIVNKQFKRVYDRLNHQELLNDPEQFCRDILADVNFKVYRILYKSIIFEVNYLRKNGKLKGSTSQERMKYFVDEYTMANVNRGLFYQEYYAVTRLAAHAAETTFAFVLEVLAHIRQSRTEIEETFSVSVRDGSVAALELGSGDVHQDGKSVVLVKLQGGQRFLYKPHSLAVDKRFGEFLQWLEEQNATHKQKLPMAIDKQSHGFSEFIPYEECRNEEEIQRFYERIGELLAVLYSLGSSDFHYENIIAYGEYPVLIDLETVIHPDIVRREDAEAGSAIAKAGKKYGSSVASIGLLPTYMKGNMEIGGLGAAKEQLSSFKTDFVVEPQNDTIHIERKTFMLKPQQNNPVLHGACADSGRYIAELETGFRRGYEWISRHKEEYILKAARQFAGCMGRCLFRPTLYYSQLLNIALHQEFARKPFERSFILGRVAQGKYGEYSDVIEAEHADLLRGSIPYFTYRINEPAVYDSLGNRLRTTKVASFSGGVAEKVESFCESDLQEQLSYIEASYITRKNQADKTFVTYKCYQNRLEPEKWLKTAAAIGEYLAQSAIEGVSGRGKQDLAWICVTLQGFEEDVWMPSVLGHEFYGGNAGIAFYLAHLWKVTGNACFLDSAKKAAELPMTLLDDKYLDQTTAIGAFTGAAGTLYMLDALADLTGDTHLREWVEEKVLSLGRLLPFDRQCDVIGGTAGYLAVARKLAAKSTKGKEIKAVIAAAAEHLLNEAVDKKDFVYWNCLPGKHYCGFSHGSAGIHTYLYLAMRDLGDERADCMLRQSLNYERSCFDRKAGNWMRSETERKSSHTWCHGAPGILLSKLLLYRAGVCDTLLKTELEQALARTRQLGIGNNPTYCHGDLGNLAILNLAGDVLGQEQLKNTNIHIFQELYRTTLSRKWHTKEMKACHTYGLMVGLAGWGYSLLSNYTQNSLPEFLWLE
ncbi:MAG: type 2 lantipeptide synthetase LanM family protein [Lachnospiraceae bacterium]|nr:type 2 lantipeptide synthetase LanM family protein [Lachnospiraceae bacterium]